jgi:hypothetical protein
VAAGLLFQYLCGPHYRTGAAERPVPIKKLASPEKQRSRAMNRMLLLQSVLGHLALLEQKYPKKAASPIARRAKRYIERVRRQQG